MCIFFFKVEYHKFCHNILYFSIHMYTHHLLLQEASRNCIIGAEPGMAISGHSLLFTGKCDHHDSTKEANYGRPPSQLLVPAYRNLAHFFGKVRQIGCLHSSSDREEERNEVRGRGAEKRVESIRLDDWEKQNEISIWPKKKQRYGTQKDRVIEVEKKKWIHDLLHLPKDSASFVMSKPKC